MHNDVDVMRSNSLQFLSAEHAFQQQNSLPETCVTQSNGLIHAKHGKAICSTKTMGNIEQTMAVTIRFDDCHDFGLWGKFSDYCQIML